MKQICVVGVGYVGLVSGACFADLGNRVIALDIDEKRVENLNKGIMPIYEPGLEELVERNVKAGRLSFTTSYEEALDGSEFAFIAVGTPSGVDGDADLQYVASAAFLTICLIFKSPIARAIGNILCSSYSKCERPFSLKKVITFSTLLYAFSSYRYGKETLSNSICSDICLCSSFTFSRTA